jgi:uncharacterized membrane protein
MKQTILYFATLFTIVLLDVTWFKFSSSFYGKELGYIFGEKMNFIPAIKFYLIYAFGILYFVINPVIASEGSYVKALVIGAFFGLIAYGTYDFTNHATIKDWPIIVTVVDIIWGMFVTGISSVIVFFIASRI